MISLYLISAQRLSNFTISVGDSFDPVNKDSFDPSIFTQCAHVPGQLGAGETKPIPCDQPVRGRYVTVNLNQHKSLSLCEVKVYQSRTGENSLFLVGEELSKTEC